MTCTHWRADAQVPDILVATPPSISITEVLPISKPLPDYLSPGNGDANHGNSNGDGDFDGNNNGNGNDSGNHNHNGDNSGERYGDSRRCGDGIGSGGGGGGKDDADDGHRRLSGAGWIVRD